MRETIIEFLKTLPEPYATQAVENYDPSFYEDGATINNNNDALGWAFDWEKSPQGADHWMALRRHLEDGDPLPFASEEKIDSTIFGDLPLGFTISFMPSSAMQRGKGVLMIHPYDYEKIADKYKNTDTPTSYNQPIN